MRLDISTIACVSFFDSALDSSFWESALNPYKLQKRANRVVINLINDMREDPKLEIYDKTVIGKNNFHHKCKKVIKLTIKLYLTSK